MTCPLCGTSYPCPHSRRNTATLAEPEMMDWSEQEFAASLDGSGAGEAVNQDYWRQEVISRLQQHRARRRKRVDSDASLSLELEFAADMQEPGPQPEIEPGPRYYEPPPLIVPRPEEVMPMLQGEMAPPPMDPPATFGEPLPLPPPDPPKVLRFPRPRNMRTPVSRPPMKMVEVELPRHALHEPGLPDPALRESALPGPVLPVAPRIVYAADQPREAEQLELLPSFDDIRLEAPDTRLTDEIELVPQAAQLRLRAMAGLVDVAIVLATTGLLAYGFMRVAGYPPLSRVAFPCLLAGSGVLWTLYQYLFLVHGEKTPGMMFAGLELTTFAGERASVFSRQCRALGCALSVFSIGLGYAWALVDEDQLGWHDRITGTCVRQHPSAVTVEPPARFAPSSDSDLPY